MAEIWENGLPDGGRTPKSGHRMAAEGMPLPWQWYVWYDFHGFGCHLGNVGSSTAIAVSDHLLGREGRFGTLDALSSKFGSECFDALVHVNPDTASDVLFRVFKETSIEELKGIEAGRRSVVRALEKLVFRSDSFSVAAKLLLRLAAAENETWGNNATGQFKQLFQLHLSGTEAIPSERFAVLDYGLSSGDDRVTAVCIEALENTLDRSHFSRSGGSEMIGSQPPLKDWRANFWGEVFDFHRGGLQRLDQIRLRHAQFKERCEGIIGSHIRSLLCENLFQDIEKIVGKIAAEKEFWLEAIKGVGDWLYFDQAEASQNFSKNVRELYDSLLPTDNVHRALLYTKFWQADIHDPDLKYDRNDSATKDYEYSSRKAKEVASEIAADKKLTDRAIRALAAEELNNAFPFAYELATKVNDPIDAFKTAVKTFDDSVDRKGIQFVRGMLSGIDERDKGMANQCMQIALDSDALKDQTVYIYTAVKISSERLKEIVISLSEGDLVAADCTVLSYGRGLDDLSAKEILSLIDELAENHEADGIWAALEIASMYQHGREKLDDELAEWLKRQITSVKLLKKVRRATRDGYLFEHLTELVHKHFGIDDEFASGLSSQITRLCQFDDQDVFFALDDPARKIIKLLVKEKPLLLWETVSRFFEIATPLEAHWLEDLIGPQSHGFDGEGHNREGVLFGIPDSVCIDWAKADPAIRAPFLCLFYPLLESGETDEQTWHPAFERLTNEFGNINEYRDALNRRLHPMSWSGSIVPYLEVYLQPLKKWYTHSIAEVSLWARQRHRRLVKEIATEQAQEDEDPYR